MALNRSSLPANRGFASALSAKLRRNDVSPRPVEKGLEIGITVTAWSSTCLGADIEITAKTEKRARLDIEVITALLDTWGNPYEVGEINDEAADVNRYIVRIHVESTRTDVWSCINPQQ